MRSASALADGGTGSFSTFSLRRSGRRAALENCWYTGPPNSLSSLQAVEVVGGSVKLDLVSATPAGRFLMALGTGNLIKQGPKAGSILEFNIEMGGTLLEPVRSAGVTHGSGSPGVTEVAIKLWSNEVVGAVGADSDIRASHHQPAGAEDRGPTRNDAWRPPNFGVRAHQGASFLEGGRCP